MTTLHELSRAENAPRELSSASSTSDTKISNDVDLLRQQIDNREKSKSRESQEVVESSSSSDLTDVLRNHIHNLDLAPLKPYNPDNQQGNQTLRRTNSFPARILPNERQGSTLSPGRVLASQEGREMEKVDDRGMLSKKVRYSFRESHHSASTPSEQSSTSSTPGTENSNDREQQNANLDTMKFKNIILKHVLNYDANRERGLNKPPDKDIRLAKAESKIQKFEKQFDHYMKHDERYVRKLARLERFYNKQEESKTTFVNLIGGLQEKYHKRLDKKYITKIHEAYEERRAHIEKNSRTYFRFFRPHYSFNWERIQAKYIAKKLAQMDVKIGFTKDEYRSTLEAINRKKITQLREAGITGKDLEKEEIKLQHKLEEHLAVKEKEWRDAGKAKIMNRAEQLKDLVWHNQCVSVVGYAASIGIAMVALKP